MTVIALSLGSSLPAQPRKLLSFEDKMPTAPYRSQGLPPVPIPSVKQRPGSPPPVPMPGSRPGAQEMDTMPNLGVPGAIYRPDQRISIESPKLKKR
ncbi:hypothetical protein EON81_16370 [bacterium]|nr:MAG: hypothetical protein EON81_16370 [bacterium]